MTWKVVVDFTEEPSAQSIHQVRNFGEALFHACEEDDSSLIPLSEIDHATNQLTVTVRSSSRVRRTVAMVNRLLEVHFLADRARVSEVKVPT